MLNGVGMNVNSNYQMSFKGKAFRINENILDKITTPKSEKFQGLIKEELARLENKNVFQKMARKLTKSERLPMKVLDMLAFQKATVKVDPAVEKELLLRETVSEMNFMGLLKSIFGNSKSKTAYETQIMEAVEKGYIDAEQAGTLLFNHGLCGKK